jgi:DNA-binding protein Fis
MAFRDAPLPGDDQSRSRESTGDHSLDRILEEKLRQMVEKVDPRTESKCALLPDIVNLVEKIVIKWALRRHHNIQTATAHFLGINRNTLRKKAKDLNIHF